MTQKSERSVFLKNLRGKWFTLDSPDFKFKSDGNYGVGVVLDEASAAELNKAIREVAEESGEQGKTYQPGEVAKCNMVGGGVVKHGPKKGERWKNTPLVYMPDLSPADPDSVKAIDRKTKFTIKARVGSYTAIGKQNEDGTWPNGCRAGGVSIGFQALQILVLDAGEPTPQEQGFTEAVGDGKEGF